MSSAPVFSERLRNRLRMADSVVVFTGAGISAESGIPTFRGDDGIWKKLRPEELASFDAFIRNPDIVWEWYQHRRKIISGVKPNPGHHAIAEMEKLHRNFSVITQNIDNLHRRAGSKNVFELHGNIERNYCIQCGRPASEDEITNQPHAPKCTLCDSLVRPDVVWFGEMLPQDEWNASVEAAGKAEVFFSIGTSAVVYPAASLPSIARSAGAYVVEVNIEPTEASSTVHEILRGPSGTIMPAVLESCYTY
jgi:NAD-dependent deacetylase